MLYDPYNFRTSKYLTYYVIHVTNFFVIVLFFRHDSYNPSWPQVHQESKISYKFLILLSLPPESDFWDIHAEKYMSTTPPEFW